MDLQKRSLQQRAAHAVRLAALGSTLAGVLLLGACEQITNSPHPLGSEKTNTFFVPFQERSPKYLDPTSSPRTRRRSPTRSTSRCTAIHYLKRPYELVAAHRRGGGAAAATSTRTARSSRTTRRASRSPRAVYDIRIRKGIMFAPHPAFAKDADGKYVYHDMKREDSPTSTRSPTSRRPARASSPPTTTSTRSGGSPRRASSRRRSRRWPTTSSASRSTARRSSTVDKELRKGIAPTDRDLPFLDFRQYSFAGAERARRTRCAFA